MKRAEISKERGVRMGMDDCLVSIPWETRNLGLQSFEVVDGFIHNPDEATLKRALKKKTGEHGQIFVQARVSKDNSHAVPLLERSGFYFIETVLVPYTKLKTNIVFERFVANKSEFLPAQYSPNDWTVTVFDRDDTSLCQRIRDIAAESFVDDRFHCDPRCDKAIADRRFSYWVDDLLADNDVIFYVIAYHGKTAGFMTRKSNNLVLGGLSRQYVGKGIGKFFWLSVLEDILNDGFSHVHTLIAVNNIPVLNLYVKLGFKFKDPAATFHYWSTG